MATMLLRALRVANRSVANNSPRTGVLIANTYIRFKLMTGLRRGDILRLKLSNLRDDGIHVLLNKTTEVS